MHLKLVIGTVLLLACLSDALTVSLAPFSFHKIYLRNDGSGSPWCYAMTVDPTKSSPIDTPAYNFLATQVWPSAREASFFLEKYADRSWSVCELGCGPGLPSLVMGTLGFPRVIATDLDKVGLEMVKKAAEEQKLHNIETMQLDLTSNDNALDEINADLYVMSDVFENGAVAEGAAEITMEVLQSGARVWCFAQSDRAQRDIYCKSLEDKGAHIYGKLEWQICPKNTIPDEAQKQHFMSEGGDRLLLIDLDEVDVNYG